MTARAKSQTQQHVIDREGQRLLKERLPNHWILRDYRPDYGIDFTLELFKSANPQEQPGMHETLGEHLFIQLKSVQQAKVTRIKLFGRGNVEKQRESLNREEFTGALDVVAFQLDTSELVTIERMGVGVPVLLVIADLATSKCFFVCLNDYIDKILIPRHDDYRTSGTRVVHVPVLNEVGTPEPGQLALRWYAKRPKLYAAFQRFVFQAEELRYAGHPDLAELAKYFASRIAAYDFWDDTQAWAAIGYYGALVQRFLATGKPSLMKHDVGQILSGPANGDPGRAQEILASLQASEIPELWRLLSVLPRNYEDVCREWFLPTSLGYLASYDGVSALS